MNIVLFPPLICTSCITKYCSVYNVCDVIIAHMISADTQLQIHTYNRCGKRKVILGPAGRTLHMQLAGKNRLRSYTILCLHIPNSESNFFNIFRQ